jgi:serine/threonine-protein kinase
MGVVYKATDPVLGRLVAIKVLSMEPAIIPGRPGERDIFIREARAAGRLSHPGIVTIHDAIEDDVSQSRYIIMEFVPGRTLEETLQSEPPPSLDQKLEIMQQVAEALEYAHEHEIIHRDLKPANILIAAGGRAKITDFGIAKIAAQDATLQTAGMLGTPAYMSPEQVTGGEVDARTDIFSVGTILYLMLTGHRPFPGDTTTAVIFKVAYDKPAPPSTLNPELSAYHDYVVLRCLAKARENRYATAREFLNDLEDVRGGRAPRSDATATARTVRSVNLASDVTAAPQAAAGLTTSTHPSARKFAVLGGVLALVIVAAFGAWRIHHSRQVPPAAPAMEKKKTPPALDVSAGGTEVRHPIPLPTAEEAPATSAPASSTPVPEVSRAVAAITRAVPLECRYQLQEGSISVMAGDSALLQHSLFGQKKSSFPFRSHYEGRFVATLRVPSEARELTIKVHALGRGESVDHIKSIAANPPPGSGPILRVQASAKELDLRWAKH